MCVLVIVWASVLLVHVCAYSNGCAGTLVHSSRVLASELSAASGLSPAFRLNLWEVLLFSLWAQPPGYIPSFRLKPSRFL